MASRPPDDAPESLVVGQFSGIRNTVSPERLRPGELESAVNVDLDDVGQVRRRRGYERRSTGRFHSLFHTGKHLLGVKNDELGIISLNGFTFTAIEAAGPSPISYTMVADTTYYSSAAVSGKIDASGARSDWGAPGNPLWLSPVVNPTVTLGEVRGQLLGAPPMATEIESWSGRIYMAHKRTLWATELFLYDYVDKTRNYLQFEDDITLVAATDNGLFVGTRSTISYLSGVFSEGLRLKHVASYGVVPGSLARVQADRVHPQARQSPMPDGQAVMFMTTQGICAGFDGGELYNITKGRVALPEAARVAALYREDSGGTTYVAAADSAGGPSANARIGDYVEARIIRASER